jgi:hypothetical protein
MGLGVLGFGFWVWGLGPNPQSPNPQSPIPNPQSPLLNIINKNILTNSKYININFKITKLIIN